MLALAAVVTPAPMTEITPSPEGEVLVLLHVGRILIFGHPRCHGLVDLFDGVISDDALVTTCGCRKVGVQYWFLAVWHPFE